MKFEVHITGEKGINEELDALSIKNIVVELLRPDLSVYRTEYMSSFVIEKWSYEDCKDYSEPILKWGKSIVEAALKAASIEAYCESVGCIGDDDSESFEVNKQSILNAYPLTNIK